MVSTKKVRKSKQIMFFTYQQKSFQLVFLLIDMQKTKTCLKQKISARAICSDTRLLTVQTGFVHYIISIFMIYCIWLHKQVAIFIKLVSGEVPFSATYSQEEQNRKTSFYSNKELNCFSCPIVRKIIFCSEFHVIPEKWWRKEEAMQLRSVSVFKQKQKGLLPHY